MRRALILIALGALLTPGLAGASSGSKSPSALVSALLNAKVTSLPNGYKSPVVSRYQVTPTAAKHHAVGGVAIVGDSGAEAVIYIVFATPADAKLEWQNASFGKGHVSTAPASVPTPSLLYSTQSTETNKGKTYKIGLTEVACLYKNVLVQGVTSALNSSRGNTAGSTALTLFALSHLEALA
jgi:hypothetical protein